VPKPAARGDEIFPKPPETKAAEAQIRHGEIKFIEQCSWCHVLGASVTPDLRKLPLEVHDLFKDILLKGALAPRGMERFDDLLSDADADKIHAYLINQSWLAYKVQEQSKTKRRCPMPTIVTAVAIKGRSPRPCLLAA
jgi:quinohemoprotein ethanol dehydrogenase